MDQTYYFHQTPVECAKELIQFVPLQMNDRVLEPFKGEGAFYNHFPNFVSKDWAEITQQRDYKDVSGQFDWVITNPPFHLVDENRKKVNSFWYFLDYYSQRVQKGIAFLANDRCFSTLTPKRMELLHQRGFHLTKMVICSVKKWRGRYFFVIFEKKEGMVNYLLPNY